VTEVAEAEKVPITGFLVGHNEAHLIADRLRELSFCDELIVVDVASTDNTTEVAEAHGARVIHHPFRRIKELIHPDVIHEARNDLVAIPDPDERIPPALAEQLAKVPEQIDETVGAVFVPLFYNFRGRHLRGTVWGGTRTKFLIARRSGCDWLPAVHRGVQLKPGYRAITIEWDGENGIDHLWASGYRQFLAKHVNFVRIEGPARALTGDLTGYKALVKTPYRSFRQSFIERKGYLDGIDGFLLSVLYAIYKTASDLALIRVLRRPKAGSAA
jgi:glycosyltransferase involved in cell wall biosynthesis